MPAFYDLPRVEQMTLLKQLTMFEPVSETKRHYPLKTPAIYNLLDPKRTLEDLRVSSNLFPHDHLESLHVVRVKYAIITCLTMEPLLSDLQLYDVWGFVLDDYTHPILICQNLMPTYPSKVAILKIGSLWQDRLDVNIMTHPRVKMLWSAAAFGVITAALSLLKN